MCRRMVLVLNSIADKMEGAHRLTVEDEGLLALAQGWAHATTHSIFFYYRCLIHTSCPSACLRVSIVATQKADAGNHMLMDCSKDDCRRCLQGWQPHASYRREGDMHACARSWLPLYLGDATLYLDACPHMSFFLAGALLTLGINLLHTFSMPLAFSGWTQGLKRRWIAVPVAHLTAALLVRLLLQSANIRHLTPACTCSLFLKCACSTQYLLLSPSASRHMTYCSQ